MTINGQSIPYTATAGTLPVYGSNNEVVASLFYVYYQRSDLQADTPGPVS